MIGLIDGAAGGSPAIASGARVTALMMTADLVVWIWNCDERPAGLISGGGEHCRRRSRKLDAQSLFEAMQQTDLR